MPVDKSNCRSEIIKNIRAHKVTLRTRFHVESLALIRNLEIIGEAAAHMPEDIQCKYPEIPWYQMKGMRKMLIHEYFGVDVDVLWRTIHDDLSSLHKTIAKRVCRTARVLRMC